MLDQPPTTPALPAPVSGSALAASAAKAGTPAVPNSTAIAARVGASTPRSGPPSSARVEVPSADDLRKELFAVYRPDQETLGQFLSRIGRLVLAMKTHKVSVAASDLQTVNEMYGKMGGDWGPKKMVRALRLRFANAAVLGL